jgi:hypothetical protein
VLTGWGGRLLILGSFACLLMLNPPAMLPKGLFCHDTGHKGTSTNSLQEVQHGVVRWPGNSGDSSWWCRLLLPACRTLLRCLLPPCVLSSRVLGCHCEVWLCHSILSSGFQWCGVLACASDNIHAFLGLCRGCCSQQAQCALLGMYAACTHAATSVVIDLAAPRKEAAGM